jgi:SAM-dependent methyltransferase
VPVAWDATSDAAPNRLLILGRAHGGRDTWLRVAKGAGGGNGTPRASSTDRSKLLSRSITSLSTSERIPEVYDAVAAEFDRARSGHLVERAYHERVLAALPPCSDILDLGCGSGDPVARFYVEAGHRVTGVDVSTALLALARERFPDCTWIQQDMRALNLKKSFAAILAWDSFFHLPPDGQRAMFPLFALHAAPGAALLFTSGTEEGSSVGSMFGQDLYHASLSTAEYARLLREHGFAVSLHRVADPDCGGHTVWLAQRESGQRRGRSGEVSKQ